MRCSATRSRSKPVARPRRFDESLSDATEVGLAVAVGLDQPLSELLPGAPPMALADLASHTAGLPRLLPSPWSYGRSHDAGDPYATEDADRLLTALARTRLRSPRVRYSNAGAGLLGLALVTATGRAYAELVRDHVATPLGLTTLSTAEPFAGHDNATGRGVAVLSNTARSVDAFAVELLRG